MTRPRRTRIEGASSEPVSGGNDMLSRIVEQFQAEHPDEWEALRLCPLQHGLDAMIEKLRG